MTTTPALPDGLRELLSRLQPSGPVDLELSARVPFEETDARVSIGGVASCYALQVQPEGLRHPLQNLRGRVRFSDDDLHVESLRGVWSTAEVLVRGHMRMDAGLDLHVSAWNVPLQELAQTHELVAASKYPIMISLGKHANDHMFSFYFATPSGWLIEIGCAGRPATHQSEYYTQDTYGHVFGEQMGPGMSIDKE